MLRIPCPFCGVRDHAEFDHEGDATVAYPPLDASEAAWVEAVFRRENPRGRHAEFWRHAQGCGAWLVVERDTATHAVLDARLAHPGMADAP